mmetsp:Transcript_6481/g.15898  ORF Transcript_6481/g.15898 Transcript_6481/m.15898 type:complete len:131 (+) Transcript_6481:251-643(+)
MCDAFVLPSRGEGWGRPHTEAMVMGLPCIATNWSGNTEFMSDANSFPIQVDGLVPVEQGAFKGHLWAEPSRTHLRSIMRWVWENPEEARRRGEVGRAHILAHYAPDTVAQVVHRELLRIAAQLQRRHTEL